MLGIICGLSKEADIAHRISGAEVACAAARPQKARWLARELIRKGATRLMSFGVAGGLEPGLPIGSLVLGTQVFSRDGHWACDSEWLNKLSQKLPAAHCGGVWGSEILIPDTANKRALYERSHCLVVDMESQCAAQIASEAKIPFAVMRAVCDTSDMNVPPAVMAAINEDGSTNYMNAMISMLRRPNQISGLIHVGMGMNKAARALEKCVSFVD